MVLSIVIPSFQQAALLANALASIQQQTFKDYEVLVMDGGSTDATSEIVSSFKDCNIRFYSEPDNGIYDAMNKGISLSRGEFLYFMGCDDVLASENVLSDIFCDRSNLDNHIIYGDVIFTKNGKRYDGMFTNMKLISRNICHQAIFTRRLVFDRIGKFNIRYKYLADYEFNIKCFNSKWVKMKYINEIIAYYNNDGSSFNNSDDAFNEDLYAIQKNFFPDIVRFLYNRRNNKLIAYLILLAEKYHI
ncbi:glycosyltransferase family 2 protein [Hymenobacter jejuensis]|uniref:Glycosyltransferase n=1 Tax=Hymenobacter jejuensis TaxID=2502781 RepID=A0A5B7ZVU7_9BACT|nr:glycosyltransferase family 2 protein [Hymenobacter jejuensis]QDA59354.1 glycosyltransferase [Hymenobacter jejuensis]